MSCTRSGEQERRPSRYGPLVPHYELAMSSPPVPDHPLMPPGHISFHGALGYVQIAWLRALGEACGEILRPPDLGMVGVTANYRRELFDGPADFDVRIERLGRSSVVFAVDISQYGELAASVQLTVARVDEQRSRSVALTPEQRAALQPLVAR
jgi:acyl-CoA thioesterase FadM